MTYINYLGIGLEIVGQYQNIFHFLKSAKSLDHVRFREEWHNELNKILNSDGIFVKFSFM